MWLIIIVVLVVVIGICMKEQRGNHRAEIENAKNTEDFGEKCRDIANKMLHEMHSGCAYSGCCVYDCTENDENDFDEDDDEEDDNEMVCYCEHYGEYVKRHSPCEHFRDRKPN